MTDQQPNQAVAVSPARAFQQELDAYGPQFAQALPSHVSVEKFKRTLLTAISQNPDLMGANRRTLFTAAVRCAADGLLPDGREAALVIYNTRVKRRGDDGIDREESIRAVQFMPMVAGIRKRMRNSGDVLSAIAEVVHKNDRFQYQLGDNAEIVHEPPGLGDDRGEAVGAYAIITLKSGEILRDVMSKKEIETTRNQSRAKDSLMWKTFWGEGAKKTVLRRCAKSAPQSAEYEALFDRDEEPPMLAAPGDLMLAEPEPEPRREDYEGEEQAATARADSTLDAPFGRQGIEHAEDQSKTSVAAHDEREQGSRDPAAGVAIDHIGGVNEMIPGAQTAPPAHESRDPAHSPAEPERTHSAPTPAQPGPDADYRFPGDMPSKEVRRQVLEMTGAGTPVAAVADYRLPGDSSRDLLGDPPAGNLTVPMPRDPSAGDLEYYARQMLALIAEAPGDAARIAHIRMANEHGLAKLKAGDVAHYDAVAAALVRKGKRAL